VNCWPELTKLLVPNNLIVIHSRFGDRTDIKPKIKIAISGCSIGCAGSLATDIGVVATRAGFAVYAGGKLGAVPKVGRQIIRRANEEKVMAVIETLFDYHYQHTNAKQRLYKLLDRPDFPYPAAV